MQTKRMYGCVLVQAASTAAGTATAAWLLSQPLTSKQSWCSMCIASSRWVGRCLLSAYIFECDRLTWHGIVTVTTKLKRGTHIEKMEI